MCVHPANVLQVTVEELRGGMVVSGPQVQIAESMRLFAGGVIMAALGTTWCEGRGGGIEKPCHVSVSCDGHKAAEPPEASKARRCRLRAACCSPLCHVLSKTARDAVGGGAIRCPVLVQGLGLMILAYCP